MWMAGPTVMFDVPGFNPDDPGGMPILILIGAPLRDRFIE